MSELKILLIEDDTVDGMFFQRTLKSTGINTKLTIAENAQEGIKLFENDKFDCVFLDYMLPGTDGLQVLATLRKNNDSSIILITSHGDEKIAVEAMKAGALDYIAKNLITAESLAQLIRNVTRFRDTENQKKKVEDFLKQSEKRHRIFFEKNQGFLCTHDLDGNFITVNEAGANSIRYTAEELIGTNFKNIISPETQNLFDDYLKALREDKSVIGQLRVMSKDGEERIWMYSNYLYEESTETYVIGSAQDVTDRFKIEEEKLISKRLAEESAEIKKMADEINVYSNKIKDSINYAKRLQNGIYTSGDEFKKVFPNSFVIDYPKEIVSGDFYWLSTKNQKKYLALADCTGHGVPGALLSTLGYTMLNNVVLNNNFTSPDQIVKALCVNWRKTFDHKKQTNNYDGMEIALCAIDYENQMIEFAAMGGSLFFMKNGELQEYRGENIGISSNPLKPFNNQNLEDLICYKIPFNKGDCIYLFSDGYQDQFGGIGGDEKFTKKRFKNLILDASKHSMEQQQHLIENTFTEWKGNNTQMDDVLVIGIQL